MKFRVINSDLLTFQPGSLREELFSWQVCDESHNRFICLRTSAHENIDVYQINFEIITHPEPRIRISAEIFNEDLLNKMRAENFSSHALPKARSRPRYDKGISANCFCEFGKDAASQNNARNFLTALVNHSKLQEFFMPESQRKALIAFSNWIYHLAQKYKAHDLALGTDWINTASQDYAVKKLNAAVWNQKKSLFTNCGLFAIAVTTSIVAVAILNNTLQP